MHPELQAALTLGAWLLVVLLAIGGAWFLRQRGLLHQAVAMVVVLISGYLILRLHELVLMLAIAGALAFIVDGAVVRLSRRMPRAAAIGIVYLGIIAVIGLVLGLLVPRVVHQAFAFARDFPEYATRFQGVTDRVTEWYGAAPEQVRTVVENSLHHFQQGFQGYAGRFEHVVGEIIGWTFKSVLILVISIYLLTDRDRIRKRFIQLFPHDVRDDVTRALHESAETLRAYLRGQGTVILFVAVSATVSMLVAGIKYAFFLGAIAGVLEVIPYFGAAVGAVPAVILGFMKSPAHGIGLILAFIAINQLEGHLVVPFVMGKNLEMRPMVILLALIGGEMLFGIPGMIIAVPVVSIIRVIAPTVMKQYQLFRMRERSRLLTQAETSAASAAAEAAAQAAAAAAEAGPPPIKTVGAI